MLDNYFHAWQYLYMPKKYMTESQLKTYLGGTYTARELSKLADISTQHAYNLLKGDSAPTDKVLERIGIKVLYEVQK